MYEKLACISKIHVTIFIITFITITYNIYISNYNIVHCTWSCSVSSTQTLNVSVRYVGPRHQDGQISGTAVPLHLDGAQVFCIPICSNIDIVDCSQEFVYTLHYYQAITMSSIILSTMSTSAILCRCPGTRHLMMAGDKITSY